MYSPDRIIIDGGHKTLTAGQIALALYNQFKLPSDALGAIGTCTEGLWLMLDVHQARRINTPCTLHLGEQRATLRRRSDLESTPRPHVVRIEDSAGLHPGELSRRLYNAAGICGEDIGALHVDHDALLAEVPRWRYSTQQLAASLAAHKMSLVEKKKRRLRPRADESETVINALECVVSSGASPARIAAAASRALKQGTSSGLAQAVQRLVKSDFQQVTETVVPESGFILLTYALEPPYTWSQKLEELNSIAFPSEEHHRMRSALQSLIDEHAEVLTPPGELESRVAGTFIPGGGKNSSLPKGNTDSIWGTWLLVASALQNPDRFDPALLRTLDAMIHTESVRTESSLGAWPKLMTLIQAEARGDGAPIHTELDEAVPGTTRHERAVIRAIDSLIITGDWESAGALAKQHAQHLDQSVPIARRVIRLTWHPGAVVDDDVALVLAGEAAWRQGNQAAAKAIFMTAEPTSKSPSATHLSMRLLTLGSREDAWNAISDGGQPEARLQAALATRRWTEAVAAWAELAGDDLGLVTNPPWLDAAIKAELPKPYCAVLDGELSVAARTLPAGHLANLCAGKPSPTGEPMDISGAIELIFETPDAQVPLTALANAISQRDEFTTYQSLIRRLIEESDTWTRQAALSLGRLGQRLNVSEPIAELLGLDCLAQWLDSDELTFRDAAVELLNSHKELALVLEEKLSHTPQRRLAEADRLMANNQPEDAARIAHAVLRKARTYAQREHALRFLRRKADYLKALEQRDDHKLLMAAVDAVADPNSLDESAVAALQQLISDKNVVERVRTKASKVLAQLHA